MILTDILSSERVRVAVAGSDLKTKDSALRVLGELLGSGEGSGVDGASAEFYRVLSEREALQSTGIGMVWQSRTVRWRAYLASWLLFWSARTEYPSTPSTGDRSGSYSLS
jgi:hypothetical protein